jgi:selenophosphate synthetase-related protein
VSAVITECAHTGDLVVFTVATDGCESEFLRLDVEGDADTISVIKDLLRDQIRLTESLSDLVTWAAARCREDDEPWPDCVLEAQSLVEAST